MGGRIESRKVQLDPRQDGAGLNVTIKVENYDGSFHAKAWQ
jgi:hypothetical protein